MREILNERPIESSAMMLARLVAEAALSADSTCRACHGSHEEDGFRHDKFGVDQIGVSECAEFDSVAGPGDCGCDRELMRQQKQVQGPHPVLALRGALHGSGVGSRPANRTSSVKVVLRAPL